MAMNANLKFEKIIIYQVPKLHENIMYETYTPENPMIKDVEMGIIVDYDLEKENHRNFLRKIYSLLLYQLFITVGMCAVTMYNNSIRNYIIDHNGFLVMGSILSFVFLIMLFCNKDNHPKNIWILTAFTISIAYTIAVTCAIYVNMGYKNLVIKAFLITILTFIVLTCFTFQSKYNFDFLQEIVASGILVLFFWGIINWVMGSDGGMIYSIFGIFIFVCAIIYDTHRLKEQFGYDNYILASVTLYLDIINLFLYILDFLRKE